MCVLSGALLMQGPQAQAQMSSTQAASTQVASTQVPSTQVPSRQTLSAEHSHTLPLPEFIEANYCKNARALAASYLHHAKYSHLMALDSSVVLKQIYAFEYIVQKCKLNLKHFVITGPALQKWKQKLNDPQFIALHHEIQNYRNKVQYFEKKMYQSAPDISPKALKLEAEQQRQQACYPVDLRFDKDPILAQACQHPNLKACQKNTKSKCLQNTYLGPPRDQGDSPWCTFMSTADLLSHSLKNRISDTNLILMYHEMYPAHDHETSVASLLQDVYFYTPHIARLYFLDHLLQNNSIHLTEVPHKTSQDPFAFLHSIEHKLTRLYKANKTILLNLIKRHNPINTHALNFAHFNIHPTKSLITTTQHNTTARGFL